MPREVTAFPFGESGAQRRERSAFPFGEGGGAAVGRGPPPLSGKVAAQPTEEVPFPFYFYFNSATIATIIETIEVNAANSPNI